MAGFEAEELWRQIPPEEKLALLSRAHGIGAFTAFSSILIGATIAVGLQLKWFLWGSILCSPLAFQFAAGRAWRSFRPTLMLEYLGARSAARRFAFATKAKELSIRLMFRGHLEEVFEEDQVQEALEAVVAKTKEAEVWVALFDEALVMLSERPGGAEIEFSQLITDKLQFLVENPDDKTEYNSDKSIILSSDDKSIGKRKIRLTSKYPAALIVFEKKLTQKIADYKERKKALLLEPLPVATDDLPADDA